MRAFVVAGLVVFHSAVVFASGSSWFINDPKPSPGFTVFLLWGSLWGMPLLFLVSGMGARYALRSRSAGAFLRERLGRLGVPLLTGLVLLVAPMFYLNRVGQPGFHEPYWRFWLRFLNPAAIATGIPATGTWRSGGDEFDPAHLWFLFSLLVFSIVLTPAFVSLRRPHGARLIGRLAGLTERHPTSTLLVAAVPIMAVEAALGPDKNTGGWERLTYLVFFLYGYLLASDRRFEQTLRRLRWWALGSGVPASVLLAVAAKILDPSAGDVVSAASPPVSAVQGLAGWLWTAAILGFAGTVAARLATTGAGGSPGGSATSGPRWRRVARYGNEAVLPFYVLHEPVIVAVAWVVVRWPAPLVVKYLSVVAASFILTLALYEGLVRRFQLTRFLFGMKPARPIGPIAHQTRPIPAAADRIVRLRWTAPGSNRPQELTVLQETFDSLAENRDMKTVLLSAITAEHERRGQPPAPRRPRRGVGRGKVDYTSPEHAGEPHRGRITEAEKSYVRQHLDQVNKRLRGKGMRTIDANDPTMRERYGLLEQIRY